MSTPVKERVPLYEEWVCFEKAPIYVDVDDHDIWAFRKGWWVTGWQGDAEAVAALGAKPRRKSERIRRTIREEEELFSSSGSAAPEIAPGTESPHAEST